MMKLPRHLIQHGSVIAITLLCVPSAHTQSGQTFPILGKQDGQTLPDSVLTKKIPQSQETWPDKLRRSKGSMKDVDGNLFLSKPWTEPKKPEPVAAPTVPFFPYTFMGKLVEGSLPKLFLTRGERLFTVSPGDVLEGIYRFDEIGENHIDITYLPLKKTQRVSYAEITPRPRSTISQANNQTEQTSNSTPVNQLLSSPTTEVGNVGNQASNASGGSVKGASDSQVSSAVGISPRSSTPVSDSSTPISDIGNVPLMTSNGGTMQMLPARSAPLPTLPALTSLPTLPALTSLPTLPARTQSP